MSSISGSVVNATLSYDANGNRTGGNGLKLTYAVQGIRLETYSIGAAIMWQATARPQHIRTLPRPVEATALASHAVTQALRLPWGIQHAENGQGTMESLKYLRGRPARKSSVFKLLQFEL